MSGMGNRKQDIEKPSCKQHPAAFMSLSLVVTDETNTWFCTDGKTPYLERNTISAF